MSVVLVGETPDELVALKPAGLPCETPRDPRADSLVRRVDSLGCGHSWLVHRLDAPACGLLLVARSRAAAVHYSREIAARRWRKLYVARVAASPDAAAALVGAHKAFLRTVGPRAAIVRSGGKPSFLDVLACSPAPSGGHSHVLIALHTGRFHQIRAMLAHLGAPLSGDVRYGGPAEAPFYLEHVALGVHRFDGGGWTVWSAPAHEDREAWRPALAEALAASANAAPATSAHSRG